MSRKRRTNRLAQIPLGQDVVVEASALLRSMVFSANRGAYAEGDEVAVLLDPQWDETGETIRVLISCYAYGHVAVDWSRAAFVVHGEGARGARPWFVYPNARGQALSPPLPPQAYSVCVWERIERPPTPARATPAEPASWQGRAAVGGGLSGLGPEQARDTQGTEPAIPRVYLSSNGKISVTFEPTDIGELIVFETRERELAEALVSFALLEGAGDVFSLRGETRLAPRGPSSWQARLPRAVSPSQGVQLMFHVIPPNV